jgi:hypothetical protein
MLQVGLASMVSERGLRPLHDLCLNSEKTSLVLIFSVKMEA